MGQYKFCVMFKFFIGIGIVIELEKGIRHITIHLPFADVYIGLEKEASGVSLFGKEFGFNVYNNMIKLTEDDNCSTCEYGKFNNHCKYYNRGLKKIGQFCKEYFRFGQVY